MQTFDLAIIGAGVAGAFASLKIAQEYKNIKTVVFELGRPCGKRRRFLEGWLGAMIYSDGKLYLNDIANVSGLTGTRRTKLAHSYFKNNTSDTLNLKVIKDNDISNNVKKKIRKAGFSFKLNNYIQLFPKEIHTLSKYISDIITEAPHIFTRFDEEVIEIKKEKNYFVLTSSLPDREVRCKQIIVCAGRSGWRWASELYESFGLVEENNIAQFGIRIEGDMTTMDDFNKSNCSISNNNLSIGPLCWNGTVIPEDHINFSSASFRSNEDRWESNKVSFNLIGKQSFPNNAFDQLNRIAELSFILSNDRISKEKISTLLANKSKISIMPEYNWLIEAINKINIFMPDIIDKGSFHIPTIISATPKINIHKDLSTDIKGMYCAGESAGIVGLLGAALTGLIAADSVAKRK